MPGGNLRSKLHAPRERRIPKPSRLISQQKDKDRERERERINGGIGGRRGDAGRSDAEGGREGGRENEGNMPDYTEETYYAFDHISGNKHNSNGNIDNLSNKSDHSNGYGTSINSSNVHGVSTKSAKSALLTKLRNKAARRNSFDSSEAEEEHPSAVPGNHLALQYCIL